MKLPRILLVEDDRPLAELIRDYLVQHELEVSIEPHGNRAAPRILSERPELVILDLMLPGDDGLSICRRVRPLYQGLILMLTARGEEDAEVMGLDLGADDYLAKPVKPRVLLSRIHALLRRTPAQDAKSSADLVAGELRMSATAREAWMSEERIELTAAEFELLWLLASNAGQILSRQTILERTGGGEYDAVDRTIDVRVSKLRQKIGDDSKSPRIIKTIRGIGYIYVA